jgi:hypothetical protein
VGLAAADNIPHRILMRLSGTFSPSKNRMGDRNGRQQTAGDNARKGAVRKRSQLKTKIAGEEHWTKRNRASGRFLDVKKDDTKFKGVRHEKKPTRTAS